MRTISVVVLSFNRPAELGVALASIIGQDEAGLEVIVVDNLSDKSREVAEVVASFPSVRLLPQEVNLGYAAGMNVGIAAATGHYIHLTEDDVTLDAGFYAALLSHSEQHPHRLVSGLLYEHPGEICVFAGAKLEIGRTYIQEVIHQPERASPYPVGMLVGLMIFGRREVFQSLQGFRAEFFVYLEDAEFCWRARRAGVELWIVPAARAWHANPGPYRFKPIIEFHKLKNYLAVNLLYMPAGPLLLLCVKYYLYTTVRKAIEGRSLRFLLRTWNESLLSAPSYLLERLRKAPMGVLGPNAMQSRPEK